METSLSKRNNYFVSKILILLFILSNILQQSWAQKTNCIGWATLNGGTSGGKGGDTIFVDNRTDFLKALKRKGSRIIFVTDTIFLKNGERIGVFEGNLTVTGIKKGASIHNGGLNLFANNVIVQNLEMGNSYINGRWHGKGKPTTDALTLYGQNIWIDHCSFTKGYDGLLDMSGNDNSVADYITVSWCKFSNHNKVMLIGSSDQATQCRGKLRATIHHCWFDGESSFYDPVDKKNYSLTQRMPRVRFGDVHVFNNYYNQTKGYCIAARFESDVVVENCFFENLKNPHIIDDREKGIENPDLVTIGNVYQNTKGKKMTHGTAFVPSDFYVYSLDKANQIPDIVKKGAGIFK